MSKYLFFFYLKDDLLKELEEKHSHKELVIMDLHNSIEQSIIHLNEAIQFVNHVIVNGNRYFSCCCGLKSSIIG